MDAATGEAGWHNGRMTAERVIDSPLGRLLLTAADRGVSAVSFEADLDVPRDADRSSPQRDCAPSSGQHPSAAHHLERAEAELAEFFAGERRGFTVPLAPPATTELRRAVHNHLAQIPYGTTRTYTQVADSVGRPRATRAIGSACGSNPLPILVPCHRVLRADGSLGGYRGGLEAKRMLLDLESGR